MDFSRTQRIAGSALLAGVLAVTACGGSAETDAQRTLSTAPTETVEPLDTPVVRRVAEDTYHTATGPRRDLPEGTVVYAAPMVIIASVAEVAGPFWNQADGQKWAKNSETDYTHPLLYREVTVNVETILRDDHGTVEDVMVFVAIGGGEGSEDIGAFDGGRFVEGERLVLFLYTAELLMRDRPVIRPRPFDGSRGVFHIVEQEGEDRVYSDGGFGRLAKMADHEPSEGDPPPRLPSFVLLEDFIYEVEHARDEINPELEVYRVSSTSAEDRVGLINDYRDTGRFPPPPPGND